MPLVMYVKGQFIVIGHVVKVHSALGGLVILKIWSVLEKLLLCPSGQDFSDQ
jgi:hypothetical protein